jgi:hypothetical protein
MEIIIMCFESSPEDVRSYISSQPGTNIQWRGDDWRVSYGFGPEVYLDIMYLTDLNSEPAWSEHLTHLKSFVQNHLTEKQRLIQMLALIDQQKFGLTVLAEPDISDWNDARLVAVREYAQRFGTLLWSSSGLFDVQLQPLVCRQGAWHRSLITTTIESCCLYFPTEKIDFKKLLPGVTSDGGMFRSPTWYEYESGDGRVRLNVKHPDLEQHKEGFNAYVARLPNPGVARAQAQALIDEVRCVAGVELPGQVAPHGSAFKVLLDLMSSYRGFMFVSDSIMLADGSFVVGPMAAQDEQLEQPPEPELVEVNPEDYRHEGPTDGIDPARVAMRERHYRTLAERGFHCARWMPLYRGESSRDELRPIREVAARVLALEALFLWVAASEEVAAGDSIQSFIKRNRLHDWLTPEECEMLDLTRDIAHREHAGSIGWKLENMWPLCWILGFEPAPTFYQGQLPSEITRALVMEFLTGLDSTIEDLTEAAEHRTPEAVGELEDLFYCAHNAVRSAQCGQANAVPADFHPVAAGGAVHERRHSLTWALSPGVDWEETDLST